VTAPAPAGTCLGRAAAPLCAEHAGRSGICVLPDGRGAFAARALLADAAESTIDAQYYIWRGDMSGTLLLEALHRAAQRGVRVRLLLDDTNTAGLDATLAALNAHPNVAVRLFNPFKLRRWRWLNLLTDFSRLNRRMHNKSFTVDNHATIIGGRNIGDEYFGAGDGMMFADLDVLAIGPVVDDVSTDFERYWNSPSAYPAERVLPAADPRAAAALSSSASLLQRNPAASSYVEALAHTQFVRDLLAGTLAFEWATTRLVSDDPAKALGRAPRAAMLPERLVRILGEPTAELQIVSPYFVPTRAGAGWMESLANRGIRVCVLTNSLEATDVAAVHAGYARHRGPLLAHGITLYELKRAASGGLSARGPRIFPSRRGGSRGGSSGSSLHAKTFAVDRSRVVVGSFNFDPRSARLNTEMAFVIDSPGLAQAMADAFAGAIPADSYAVHLMDSGRLQWIEQQPGSAPARIHGTEPGTTFWQRGAVHVLSLLPIDWLL